MINFERFITRRGIDIKVFFTVNGINTDQELVEYCKENGMTTPESSYFDKEIKPVQEAKKAPVKKAPAKKAPAKKAPAKKAPAKQTRTRKTRTKKESS